MGSVNGTIASDYLPHTPADRSWRWWLKCIARILLTLVAAFWAWFAVGTFIHEGASPGAIPYVLQFLLPLAILLIVAWRWPRIGGAMLVLAGIFAAFFFHHWFAQLALALPAIAIGSLLVLLR